MMCRPGNSPGAAPDLAGRQHFFSAQVFSQVAQDLAADEAIDHGHELRSVMLFRVKDAYLQMPFYVDGQLELALPEDRSVKPAIDAVRRALRFS